MGSQELVMGRCSSPTACHADPRWQAASQSSHPFPHCLTVLALHLAQQPGLTERGFLKSGRVIYGGREGGGAHLTEKNTLCCCICWFLDALASLETTQVGQSVSESVSQPQFR